MTNGARPGVIALFFVLGMAFMAAIFLLAHPQWSEHEKVRLVSQPIRTKVAFVEEPATDAPIQSPEPAHERIEVAAPIPPGTRNDEKSATTPSAQNASDSIPLLPPEPDSPARQTAGGATRPNHAGTARLLSLRNLGGPGTLRGAVTFAGKPPAERGLPLDAKCHDLVGGKRLTTHFYAVGPEGGLAGVIVKVVSPIPKRHWPTPADPHTVANFRCQFDPYISAMQAGQRLVLENRDGLLHNAHVIGSMGGEADYALMPKAKPLEIRTDRSGELKISCDVHPWEFAFITVVEHPYFAVTDLKGAFEIKGLPAGKYVIEAVHRKAGTNTLSGVEMGSDGGWVDIEFKAPAGS